MKHNSYIVEFTKRIQRGMSLDDVLKDVADEHAERRKDVALFLGFIVNRECDHITPNLLFGRLAFVGQTTVMSCLKQHASKSGYKELLDNIELSKEENIWHGDELTLVVSNGTEEHIVTFGAWRLLSWIRVTSERVDVFECGAISYIVE